MKNARAFTLLETLFAIAISGVVMVGACALMFDMASVLRHFEEGEPFDLHVNGVENFLKSALRNSDFPSGMDYSLTGASGTSSGKLLIGNPPDATLAEKRKICFGILNDMPLYIAKRGFSPEKVAWLDFREDEGLYLLWTFIKNEDPDSFTDERCVYEFLISAYVEKFEYVYIEEDTGRWLYEEDMDMLSSSSIAAGSLPKFLKLTFKRGAETFERYVPLSPVVDSQFAPSQSASSGQSGASSQQGQSQSSGGGRR